MFQVKKAYDGVRYYQNQVRNGVARYQITDVEIYNILIQAMANLVNFKHLKFLTYNHLRMPQMTIQ